MNATLKEELENIKITQSIDAFENGNTIQGMIKLTDGKILVNSKDKTLKIFDPINNYNCEFTSKLNTENEIVEIISLQNGHIVIAFKTPLLEIYSLNQNEIKKELSLTLRKNYPSITSLTKNRFASIGTTDTKIQIWKGDAPYSETPIAELEGDYNSKVCLTQLKDKEILAFGGCNIYLWDLNDYKCIKVIKSFYAGAFFTQLTDDIFASNENLINIQTEEKTQYYKQWYVNIYSGMLLSNGKMVFTSIYSDPDHGGSDHSIGLFDLKTIIPAERTIEKFSYSNPISIDEHTFITSKDNCIKIWKY